MSKPDLTTREAVLERFRDGLEWGFDDDDVPTYWPEDWELAAYIAECVRLRVAFDGVQDDEHRMWDGGHSINDLNDYLRARLKGGDE